MKSFFQLFLIAGITTSLWGQNLSEQDSLSTIDLEEVKVAALRTDQRQPMAFSNVDKSDLAPRNLGQDIPILLNYLPGVVTTSDAGAGVGYTGIRVRGSDATRVNVTINGIPYNDAESHGTYWVNLPDFASSVESLQLQRGVGTSTNGTAAFGASINLLTNAMADEAYTQWSVSGGSFNTLRNSLKFSTGRINDHFEFSGRLAKITSDGYIDRARSDLKSYFLQGVYQDQNTLIKAIGFGGHEITYQSWYGLSDEQLDSGISRTYNIAGQIFDANGNLTGFYPNQEDNYRQDHYQLHWTQQWNSLWSFSMGLNYTYGRGFYEEYNDLWYDENVAYGGVTALSYLQIPAHTIGGRSIESSENVTRKWLDNDYYVATLNFNRVTANSRFNIGLLASTYDGDHFGTLIWAAFPGGVLPKHRFYTNKGKKSEFSAFAKGTYDFSSQWSGYLDVQWRGIRYTVSGNIAGPAPFEVDESYGFFNPKAGILFSPDAKNQLYLSYARAQREPNRTDFENGNPKPEKLNDFELGWRFETARLNLKANVYYMGYQDQLVLTGAVDAVGSPIRENVGNSRRIGLELDAKIRLADQWLWAPNLSLSSNKNLDFYFKRDGVLTALGNTNISYSPSVVAGNALIFAPSTAFQLGVLSKYVGEQYMGNIDAVRSKLSDYFVSDLTVRYTQNPSSFIDKIEWSLLVNNLFDRSYISNGYFYTYDIDGATPSGTYTVEGNGLFPQAGIHFLAGASIQF